MSSCFYDKEVLIVSLSALLFFASISCLFSSHLPEQESSDKKGDLSAVLQDFFKTGNIAKIRPLLPEETRIFLSLDKIKNAKGFFSAHQTLLIFKDFFQHNHTVSIQILSDQQLGPSPSTIKASLIVRDSNAKIKEIDLNITLQKQAGSWKIKEIKETAS